jgi:lysophospholipase L1-like esterase
MLAVALLVMSLTPAGLLQGDYRTLPANMGLTIEVSSKNVPGIEGPQRITTDAKGFRTGNRVIQYEDATPYRIFAIGASTTEQAYLDDSKTWTRLLEGRLKALAARPVEVINTGVAGLRLVHHLATQDRIEDLSPDLVVFLPGVNDWNHQITTHFDRDERFRKPLSDRLRFRFRRSVVFTFHQIYIALPQRSKLVVRDAHFTAMDDRKSRPYVVQYSPQAVSEYFAQGMASLVERCDAGSYRCMLLTQPTAYYTGAPAAVTQYFRLTPPGRSYTLDLDSLVRVAGFYNDFVRDLAAKHALAMCDLDAVVPKGTEAFYDDVHFNTNGARIVAQAMTDCIVDLVPDL